MSDWLKNSWPGALVAAAFIGPGTVTVCTIAGVRFGYELLWEFQNSVDAGTRAGRGVLLTPPPGFS